MSLTSVFMNQPVLLLDQARENEFNQSVRIFSCFVSLLFKSKLLPHFELLKGFLISHALSVFNFSLLYSYSNVVQAREKGSTEKGSKYRKGK